MVQPPLLNGGFEQDSAGDGNPDYWNYRTPDTLYMKGVTLDRAVFCEGRQSLRLDPYSQETANALHTTYIRLVPGRRYRLSLSIRRSAHHPGIGAHFFSMCTPEKATPVRLDLGRKESGPLDTWEQFAAEFTVPNLLVPHQLILQNNAKGAATVWFDAATITELP